MSQVTSNTSAFIEASQYSQFILENLHDGLLPEGFYRNVSDFGTGTTLNIKTIGSATIQDVAEGTPLTFNPIETGNITMSITNYIGDAWSVSDELRQEGSQIEQLQAARAMESTRALQETFESKFLNYALNNSLTLNDPNSVNGFQHKFYAGGGTKGTTLTFAQDDFIYMKLAFDKANVPQQGRVAIVDPVVEATINSLAQITAGILDRNPMWEAVWESGFAQNHKFIANIFGWDIYTSNRLATTTGDLTSVVTADGTAATGAAGNVANVFMSVVDDSTRPLMGAWRVMPSVEGWRDPDNRQDKFQTTAKFGFGLQRAEALGIVLSSATAY